MKITIPIIAFSLFFTLQADAARGRPPCSGSKGGIAHCTSDGRFVCNDGSLSQSKRFCSGYGASENSQKINPSVSTKKTQSKMTTTVKKKERQSVVENNEQINMKTREPTCAPLYMASKPGFTHLPICSDGQY